MSSALPDDPQPVTDPARLPGDETPVRNATVLLVEDDTNCLRGLARGLRASGYTVLCATNGSEALDIARVQHVDVIVTDLLMPCMDGVDLLLNLKLDHASIPVVAITGVRATNRLVRGARLYGARVLEKPFDHATLTRAVSGALGG